jgi:RimJ/RimL family protein N-acetyltransferase
MTIRQATNQDAKATSELIAAIAAERIYTAIDQPFTPEQEADYIANLSPREAIFIAETEDGQLTGLQTLEQWAATINSMSHVAQIGTFIAKPNRNQGLGHQLFQATKAFAQSHNYKKLLAQVRASNTPALAFYQKQGFQPAGRLLKQVIIDGTEDDEIILELFI